MTVPEHAAPHAPAQLCAAFEAIGRERMAGLGLAHPALAVEALGFARAAGPAEGESGWFGVLLTPWCMNLVWWPDRADAVAAPGATRTHVYAGERYRFIGAHEAALGAFETCSLFSPMDEFRTQAEARALALAVLAQLRRASEAPAQPSRRALLTGLRAIGPGPA